MKAILLFFILSSHAYAMNCEITQLEEIKAVHAEVAVTYKPSKNEGDKLQRMKDQALQKCQFQGGSDCRVYKALGDTTISRDEKTNQIVRVYRDSAFAQSIYPGQEKKIKKNCRILKSCYQEIIEENIQDPEIDYRVSDLMEQYNC